MPTMVRQIAPSPPAMLVPPMTTAAIAVNSIRLPASACPVETREEAIRPARPAANPLIPSQRFHPADTDAGEARGLGVAADGVDVSAELWCAKRNPQIAANTAKSQTENLTPRNPSRPMIV